MGLALQGSLSNFAAGVLMLVFRPFVEGVFIESNDRFPVGQKIRMAFELPNAPNAFELEGQINRSGLQGIGVNFLGLNQDQQEIIRAYIANQNNFNK